MADWGKGLPPIMEERLAEISAVTSEDNQKMRDLENLDSMLRDFYTGELDAYNLWQRLKLFRSGISNSC